ncbi:MAG: ABC transporter ATP-binding protein [Candidatus Hodarchaeales archaeon]|jgi:multiple sugar transport system ATP-binding protein
MATIEFDDIVKDFGAEEPAVKNFSLGIPDQEFLVIVGPSGCGKSTVLRMLAGLETPTTGEIKIDGQVVNHLTPKQRDIAMVFQSYALYPHKNVADNLAFPLTVSKVKKDKINQRVNEVAEQVGISELLDRKPKELSGGQRQRVALGRAIIRHPRAFLMDEPLSNLDAKLRVKMRAELKKLQRKLKITTLYVTHDQVEAMTMGDRIAVFNFGVLQQVGTPDDIFYRPANRFVAGFIGSPPMNFIDAEVGYENEKLWLQFSSLKLPVPEKLQAAVKTNNYKQLIMGIRPQHIKSNPTDFPSEYLVSAEVTVSQPRGTEIDVEFAIGEDLFLAVFPPEHPYDMGQAIEVGFEPNHIYLFDPESGKTIF